MAHATPDVVRKQLYLSHFGEPICDVDSPAWFDWLQTATTFRYHSQSRRIIIHGHGPTLDPISVRKERRRRGALWYAYRRSFGVLHKRYVGKTEAVTLAQLEKIAVVLNEI